jgi:hypothetical protein
MKTAGYAKTFYQPKRSVKRSLLYIVRLRMAVTRTASLPCTRRYAYRAVLAASDVSLQKEYGQVDAEPLAAQADVPMPLASGARLTCQRARKHARVCHGTHTTHAPSELLSRFHARTTCMHTTLCMRLFDVLEHANT